ncbi:MAG: FUSC family protein [Longimicrobiaceae bacterium]
MSTEPLIAPPRLRGPVRELARWAARPNLAAGLRAAVATVAPVLVAHALGVEGASWAGLAGFVTAIADKGGAYRTRAETMGALALAVALGGVLGAVASVHPAASIPAILLWATAGALLRAFGAGAGSVGTSMTIVFIISLATPGPGAAAVVERGALLLAGSAGAMALSLFLWPIRAYRPARHAVAECWRALAGYADAVAAAEPRDFARFRAALEAARATLAATRRGRPGETGRGERLLMLAEAADRTFAATTALGGALDAADEPEAERAHAAAAAAASLAREIADAVEHERRPAPAPSFPSKEADEGAAAWIDQLVENLRREAMLGWSAAAGVESGRRVQLPDAPHPLREASPLDVLRGNLNFRSVTFRHALRVGVTAAAATALAHLLGVQRGYWITLTALIVLQPSAGATWVKGMQRIGGTVAGGLAAAGVMALVHDPRMLLAVVFVLAAAAVSVLQVNYGVYSALLTPTFVLLAETTAADRHLPGIRVVNTLLGGVLALAAARLLWPAPERLAFRGRLAEALRACGAYLRTAMRAHAGAARRAEADDARRQTGLAVLNAEESLQLVLWEGRRDGQAEAGMAALAYLRRLGEGANALAYAPPADEASAPAVIAFGDAAEAALASLADGASPAPLHAPDAASATEAVRFRAIAEDVAALRRIVEREA